MIYPTNNLKTLILNIPTDNFYRFWFDKIIVELEQLDSFFSTTNTINIEKKKQS